jgi:asparagine synthase (glutamine-hydrolysing)
MCGICGVFGLNNNPVNTRYIKSMCDVIAHRGPDDAGYLVAQTRPQSFTAAPSFLNFTDRHFSHQFSHLPVIDTDPGQQQLRSQNWDVFLGFRRLSIIDTSPAGHQPMSDDSKKIWIVFNGEIYNFKELKQELINLGYPFVSTSDTEVIIYAYKEWGIDSVKKFNGMFAFALLDQLNNTFYLARDRYGIKPLYYTELDNRTLIFGSEIKSILSYKDYQMAVDYEALLEYFTFQNIFTDKTLYKNIKLLPAGFYIEIDFGREQMSLLPTIHQYWDFKFAEPENPKREEEYLEELDRLFVQAVKRQLVSDVEVGSYLSGGMDSGSITSIAAQHFPFLKTFTVGFDLHSVSGMELAFDEREKSEYMSYLFKTEHYEMVLKSGDMERVLPLFTWHLEDPRVGQSYPNFYAAKLAGRFVKVVLAGTGGDETFAGYPWRYYKIASNKDFEDYIDKYYVYWQRLIPNREIAKVFAPIWNKVRHVWTRDIFRDVFKSHEKKPTSPEEYINYSLYFEAKTFMHGLLVVEDKLSMAHSLETRIPFMDNDLVDFALEVPLRFKLRNLKDVVKMNENEMGRKNETFFQKTNDGKLILRKVMQRYIPQSITTLVKQGFSSPDQSWFKGDSMAFVKNKLFNPNAHIYDFFDRAAIRALVEQHLKGEKNRRLLIWSLLNFEEWCEQFFK